MRGPATKDGAAFGYSLALLSAKEAPSLGCEAKLGFALLFLSFLFSVQVGPVSQTLQSAEDTDQS